MNLFALGALLALATSALVALVVLDFLPCFFSWMTPR